MNKDKAIQLLERLQDPEPYEPMLTKYAYDAIQMAIDALSADGDTISRKAAIEVIDSFNVFESRCDQIKLEQMIGELPPANTSEIPNSSDTISRAKAIEALGTITVYKGSIPFDTAMMRIEQLPSAQPDIVRCKDCKYWNSGSCEYPEHAVNCQDYWVGDIETEAEHFCGYAKRREVTT